MATYRVKGPDGSTYNVTAPDGASQDEVLTRVKNEAASRPSKGAGSLPRPPASVTKQPRSLIGTAADYLGDVVDNIVPNWGDELAGMANVLASPVPSREQLQKNGAGYYLGGRYYADRFKKGREDFKSAQAQYDKDHPALSWVSTLGGTAAGLALPGGAAAKGAGWAAKARQGAKVGAAYGALAGAGDGENLSERAGNAVTGAGVGAAGGAVLASAAHHIPAALRAANRLPGVAAVTRTLGNVPRAVMRKTLRTRTDDVNDAATRMAASRMSQGTIDHGMGTPGPQASPEAIAAEVQRRSDMGVPAMVADTTDAMRSLTGWAARGEGPGQQMVRQAINNRQRDAATRTRQHVVDTMGEVGDPIAQVESLVAKSKADAAPLYKEAYAQPMVVTPEIEGIMKTPAFQEALPHAVRNIRNAQRNPTELGFRMDAEGNIQGAQTLTAEGFDQVIRAMRDNGRAAMAPGNGFRPVDTTDSVHINNRARDLRGQLADQNPAYADVTARYADDMAQRDARLQGADVAALTGHEINAQARAMPENAQASWSIGARTALADKASQDGAKYPTANIAERVRQAMGDEVKQDAIGRMSGNDGGVRQLLDRLEAENQGHRTWQEVYGNSRTASRQAADEALNDLVQALPKGASPRHLLTSAVDFISARSNARYRNAVKARIAEIVTLKDPKDVHELMAAIQRQAEQDADFRRLLDRSGIVAAKAYGRAIVPQD